jgi:hypothetical protein
MASSSINLLSQEALGRCPHLIVGAHTVDLKVGAEISFFILFGGESFANELFVSTPLGSLLPSVIPL